MIHPPSLYRRRPALLADDLGLELDPWQVDALNDHHSRILLNAARQTGKSTVMALKAVAYALFQPGSLTLVVAPTQDQSDELLDRVHRFYRMLGRPVALTAENIRSLRLLSGSRIVALPGDARAADHIRGFSAVNLLCVDEASRTSDELLESVRPMLAVSSGQIVASSTPAGRRGWWWLAWSDQSQSWRRVEIPATACVRIQPDFLERERRELGERVFAAEYCCSFQENIAQYFPESVLERIIDSTVESWSSRLWDADDIAHGAIIH